MKKFLNKKIKIPILFLSYFIFTKSVFAELPDGYVPLEALPGITTDTTVSFEAYVNAMFQVGIGVAIVLAVIVIVIAGVEYIGGASNETMRADAKDKITRSIVGLLIVLGSWLLLNIINPSLTLIPSLDIEASPTAQQFLLQPTEHTNSITNPNDEWFYWGPTGP